MISKRFFVLMLCLLPLMAWAQEAEDSALLFYLSAENGTTADFSRGKSTPNFPTLPQGTRTTGYSVVIDPGNKVEELYETNNRINL